MKELSTYLNDHLAGSTGALEMLEDMIKTHAGKPIEQFLIPLHREIESDQSELKDLMHQLEIGESTMRKAGAWVAEKLSRAKLRAGDAGEPSLELLQSLEGLSLGITGKRALWRMLAKIAETSPRVNALDYARLEARAANQFERVEAKAIEIGRGLFPAELDASVPE